MKAKRIINKDFKNGIIDKRIYSSFVEHMGRVIYGGIYEQKHPLADEDGFRKDVLELVEKMGVTAVRYPGGNFVSFYDWRDGIGPKQERPRRLELAWRSIETNEIGTNEFMVWAQKAGIEPIWAVNLGTKGIENAVSLLEYCNIDAGSFYSDLRRQHGVEKPYKIKTWCLGNEMDGEWQIGHKTAHEYGRLAQETAKAMKLVDPDIKLVSCGSSKSDMETYPDWEAITLSYTYDYVDYISLHQYYGGQEKGTPEFLAQALDMENYIKSVIATCDYVKAKKRSAKQMNISFDEWGVWEIPDKEVVSQVDERPWQEAPHLSEQIYTMEDALLFASMMMNFLRYSDRIKIACQSLLTNISAAIMTEEQGEAWVQPIYYPFAHMSAYGRGVVLEEQAEDDCYQCETFKEVPYLDSVAVYNEQEKEVAYFLVNRSEDELEFLAEIQQFKIAGIKEHLVMYHENKKATNKEDHNAVKPIRVNDVFVQDKEISCKLRPLSWNVIRIDISEK